MRRIDELAVATPRAYIPKSSEKARAGILRFHGLVNNHVYARESRDEVAGTMGGLSELQRGLVKNQSFRLGIRIETEWIRPQSHGWGTSG